MSFARGSLNRPTDVRVTTEDVDFVFQLETVGEYLVYVNSWRGNVLLPTFTASPDGYTALPDGQTFIGFTDAWFCIYRMPFQLCRDEVGDKWRFAYQPAHGGSGEVYVR